MTPIVSVVIPTHNPDLRRLARVLSALRAQTLPAGSWETILVDNASDAPLDAVSFALDAPGNLRVVREARLGLSTARARGFAEARGAICVLVDDDNILSADYLAESVRLMGECPHVHAMGGRVVPEFERDPQSWHHEFLPLLAVRDFGETSKISTSSDGYPPFSPIGAGMVIRSAAANRWADSAVDAPSDRRGRDLGSGGDNDIVFSVLERGGAVAYHPQLRLTHLIPASRLETRYLERLNRGIQRSWMEVLSRHGANPWPRIPSWTVPLRKVKAWIAYRAWTGPDARVRWQGACGHFEGRASASAER